MTQGSHVSARGQFQHLEPLLADVQSDALAQLITAAADVVLILDREGVIRDLAVGNQELLASGCESWIGKAWSQTVTVESQPKIHALLQTQGAPTSDGVRWRQVNQLTGDGGDMPIAYSVAPIDAGDNGHSVAFGRDLRPQVVLQQRLVSAQQTMERDYWRLRQIETRYRLLFQMAAEPVLIFEGGVDRLEEANPAAYELLGDAPRASQWSLLDSLDPESVVTVQDAMAKLRAIGRCEPVVVRVAGRETPMRLTATQFRQDNRIYVLVRLGQTHSGDVAPSNARQLLLNTMESAPDALVVTDTDGRLLSANRTFLDLAQLANEELAIGQPLDQWLGRTGVDCRVLLTHLRQHGTVRLFATQLRGAYGSVADVEVSAVSVADGPTPCLGLTIRDIGRRINPDGRAPKELPRSASQMTELVGRLPLKDIVRETTDLIEQLCIEAALELTGDNRASAAEMLGLSRQSLYIKLRKLGIMDSAASAGDDTTP